MVCFLLVNFAQAAERAGTVKTLFGHVSISRGGEMIDAKIDDPIMQGDTVTTGFIAFVGITMLDNTRMTVGPFSSVVINHFDFDTTTHQGKMDTSVKRGTLSVISGKIAKASPESVTFNTNSMTLGVRGTEFIIESAGESVQ